MTIFISGSWRVKSEVTFKLHSHNTHVYEWVAVFELRWMIPPIYNCISIGCPGTVLVVPGARTTEISNAAKFHSWMICWLKHDHLSVERKLIFHFQKISEYAGTLTLWQSHWIHTYLYVQLLTHYTHWSFIVNIIQRNEILSSVLLLSCSKK